MGFSPDMPSLSHAFVMEFQVSADDDNDYFGPM